MLYQSAKFVKKYICNFWADWRRLPSELKVKKRKVRHVKSAVKPNIPPRKKASTTSDVEASEEIAKTLEVRYAVFAFLRLFTTS